MNIMVIGAGQMGGGIAQVMAVHGHRVFLNDVDRSFIDKRLAFIDKLLTKDVAKERITEAEKNAALANLVPSLDLADAAQAELVIEAAVEDIAVKKEIFRKLSQIAGPECILASNTSSLPITEIAAVTGCPERVIGMHFMNPAPVMKLVELIRGLGTSDGVYDKIRALVLEIGKVPVEVRDVPGFALNRILELMINEAIYCLYEGVASREDIDAVMKYGANHPMGPLQLADLIGLDTLLAILETMYEGFGDPKYRPCPLLRQYVRAGWLGRKTGRGFYTYD